MSTTRRAHFAFRSKKRRLVPEMVPMPLWGVSAYRLLGRGAAWKQIRLATIAKWNRKCAACASRKQPLYCHEVWKYQDTKKLALLVGFEPLCEKCNLVAHIGWASTQGLKDEAVAHLQRLNRLTERKARRIVEKAFETWKKRSNKRWRVRIDNRLLSCWPSLKHVQSALRPVYELE